MTYLNPLWLAYDFGLLLFAGLGGAIALCGGRGKLTRAFLVAPLAGLAVFWLTHAIYLLVVPVPIAPPHHPHDDDLLGMLYAVWSFLFDRLAPSIAYRLGLYCDPVIYGSISIPIAFIASFFFPCKRASQEK